MKLLNYSKFKILNESIDDAKKLLNKLGTPLDNEDFKKIQKWLVNNSGYLPWFTKLRFQNKEPIEQLEKIWITIKDNKRVISKFTKPIIELSNAKEFWDMFNKTEEDMMVKSMYNELLPRQKVFIDINDNSDYKLLLDFYKDKENKKFIKKLKRYWTRGSLINAMSNHVYKKTSTDFDELIDELEKNKVEIWYADKEQDIIACTVDFPQLVEFASDTDWCTLEKSQFDMYNSAGKQWLFFLLDQTGPYSKIGASSFLGQDSKIRFSDCRLKGDINLSINELYITIESRGCSKDIFYIPMKKHFENSSINIDFLSIKTLLDIGLEKKEILKRKKRFQKEDLLLLSDEEKELISKSVSYQQQDDERIQYVLSKLNDEQKKCFNLESEHDYNLLLKVSKDKNCDRFLENSKYLTSIDILKPSFEKFAYVKDNYDYDSLKSSLLKNNIKILTDYKESNLIITLFEPKKLQKIADNYKFKLPQKLTYEGYKSKHIELELMIFKFGIEDIFSRLQLDIIFYQDREVSNKATEFDYNCNLVDDTNGKNIPVKFTQKFLMELLNYLKVEKETLNKFMKEHISKLDNWNSLSVEMLSKLGFDLEHIVKKKSLFISEDLNKLDTDETSKLKLKQKLDKTNELFIDNVLDLLPKKLKKEYKNLNKPDKELLDNQFIELNLLGSESMKTFLSTTQNTNYIQDVYANLKKFISLKNWQKLAKS